MINVLNSCLLATVRPEPVEGRKIGQAGIFSGPRSWLDKALLSGAEGLTTNVKLCSGQEFGTLI